MKYLSVILILLSNYALSDTLTIDSYKGVQIGIDESEALKILKTYRSTKDSDEPNSTCYYLEPSEKQDEGVALMVLNGHVSRIDVFANKRITTTKGIHIGSTKTDVLKKYYQVKVSPHPYISPDGEYLEVKLTDKLGIIFETDKDIITSFRLGDESIHYIEGCL